MNSDACISTCSKNGLSPRFYYNGYFVVYNNLYTKNHTYEYITRYMLGTHILSIKAKLININCVVTISHLYKIDFRHFTRKKNIIRR